MIKIQSYIARQSIFNQDQKIVGYELLHRFNYLNQYQQTEPNEATLQVLKNVFFHNGYKKLSDNKLLFLNFTRKLIFSDVFDVLEPRFVVIELLETVHLDDLVIRRIKELKRNGFMFALDDVNMDHQSLNDIVEQIDIAKVDFRSTTKTERRNLEKELRKNTNIILLAEKIETEADYNEAMKSSYHLSQGYYFGKPEMVMSEIRNKKLV